MITATPDRGSAPLSVALDASASGYRQLGERYATLLGRDLYGVVPTADVAPPDPASARLEQGGTQVVITMRNEDSVLSFAEGSQADFWLEGAAVTVTGGAADGHEIVLTLSGDATGATGVTGVTYLGHIGAGPWVLNESGVDLLGFGSLPITP